MTNANGAPVTKRCCVCREVKTADAFGPDKGTIDGLLARCRRCKAEYQRAYRAKNADRISAYLRAYRAANPERIAEHRRAEAAKGTPVRGERSRARELLNYEVFCGRIVRQPCEGCRRTDDVEAHHEDYAKPYDVHWLCPACHGREHRLGGEPKVPSRPSIQPVACTAEVRGRGNRINRIKAGLDLACGDLTLLTTEEGPRCRAHLVPAEPETEFRARNAARERERQRRIRAAKGERDPVATAQHRSEELRRHHAARTPEERSETLRKAWVTRRAGAAAKGTS